MAEDIIVEGDTVLLLGDDGSRFLVRAAHGVQRIGGLGVVNTGRLVGHRAGTKVELVHKFYQVLRPGLADHLAVMERGAQIIMPKDAGLLIHQLGVRPGALVLEVGGGSGAFTMVLAQAVGPTGKVRTYEARQDHANRVRRNLETAGLADRVEIVLGDARVGLQLPEGLRAEAAVLDMPDPWTVLPVLWPVLRPGAMLGCVLPTTNQVEAMVRALRNGDWIQVRALELLERELVVGERGTRPSFEMLGHTAYLVFGRRVHVKASPGGGALPKGVHATKPKHGGSG